nr:hypothetical protein [Tanacetum cinerariifolium]
RSRTAYGLPLPVTSEGRYQDLHPELPGPEERIVDFPKGKQEIRKNTHQCYTKPLDSLKNWNNRFFWVDKRVFPTVANWHTNAPKNEMPAVDTYFAEAVAILNTYCTPIQKQPEALLYMDLFNLIRAPNLIKVKTGTRPRAAHEVPLLTVTVSYVIEMKDPAIATDSSGVPSTIERSPLDFANENLFQQLTRGNETEDQGQETVAPEVPPLENVTNTGVAPEAGLVEEIAAMGPRVIKERIKRGNDGVDTNAPPKLQLRFEHEAKLLKKSVAQVARRVQRIQARENEIKNLEALLKAETDIKKTTKAKNAKLDKDLENPRALFSDLQVSNDWPSQQVSM